MEKKSKAKFIRFSFIELFLRIFRCRNETLDKKLELYKKANIVLNDYLDISYIIEKLEEIEKLKIVLFSFDQLVAFNFAAKPYCTLDPNHSKENLVSKLSDLIRDKERVAVTLFRFRKRVTEHKELSDTNKRLYELIREDLK